MGRNRDDIRIWYAGLYHLSKNQSPMIPPTQVIKRKLIASAMKPFGQWLKLYHHPNHPCLIQIGRGLNFYTNFEDVYKRIAVYSPSLETERLFLSLNYLQAHWKRRQALLGKQGDA